MPFSKPSLGGSRISPPSAPSKENLGAFLVVEMLLGWVLSLGILKGTASSLGWMRWCPGTPSDSNYSVIPGMWLSTKLSPLTFPDFQTPISDCSRQSSKENQEDKSGLKGPGAEGYFSTFLWAAAAAKWVDVKDKLGVGRLVECFSLCLPGFYTQKKAHKIFPVNGILSLLCLWFSTSVFAVCFWRDINGRRETGGRKVQVKSSRLVFQYLGGYSLNCSFAG